MSGRPPASPRTHRRRERQRVRIVIELLIGAAAIWFVTHPAPLPDAPEPPVVADSLRGQPTGITIGTATDSLSAADTVAVPDTSRAIRDSAKSRRLIPSLRIPRPVLPARLLRKGGLFRSTAERAKSGERIAVTMTAYCLQGRTRRGNLVRDGIIAVDRSVFPLGRDVDLFFGRSKYGRFLADDTGRDIVGGRIDVWIEDCREARRFGRRRGYAQLVMREP